MGSIFVFVVYFRVNIDMNEYAQNLLYRRRPINYVKE
jgi:hypothetical protein